jgi:hypothetical protein
MEECERPIDFVEPITYRGGLTVAQRKHELEKRGLRTLSLNICLSF